MPFLRELGASSTAASLVPITANAVLALRNELSLVAVLREGIRTPETFFRQDHHMHGAIARLDDEVRRDVAAHLADARDRHRQVRDELRLPPS